MIIFVTIRSDMNFLRFPFSTSSHSAHKYLKWHELFESRATYLKIFPHYDNNIDDVREDEFYVFINFLLKNLFERLIQKE